MRSYSYEILLLIIPAVYERKGCEAFGKREIIANAALINMSLLRRVAPLHVSKGSKIWRLIKKEPRGSQLLDNE